MDDISAPGLRGLLESSARALLAEYPPQRELAAESGERQLCGILGFTGDALCGSVVIVTTPDVLAAINPVPDVPLSRWLAELTNQLVGRFKNEVLRRGTDVSISVPVVFRATHMEPILHLDVEPIELDVEGRRVSVWLESEGSVELCTPADDGPREGEAILF